MRLLLKTVQNLFIFLLLDLIRHLEASAWVLEAEDQVNFEGGKAKNRRKGWTGSGYFDFTKNDGYLKFDVPVSP